VSAVTLLRSLSLRSHSPVSCHVTRRHILLARTQRPPLVARRQQAPPNQPMLGGAGPGKGDRGGSVTAGMTEEERLRAAIKASRDAFEAQYGRTPSSSGAGTGGSGSGI
jgi:hypothetical protein